MFKVIYDNKVVDLLEKVIYLRFIPSMNKVLPTDGTSAHGFYSSDYKTIYQLEGKDCPLIDRDVVPAKLVKITEQEFNELKKLLEEQEIVSNNKVELARSIASKISELSEKCQKEIISGITIRLSDGKMHKFELTIEDQLNLASLQTELNNGAKKLLYHEKGELLRYFESSDMSRIIRAATKHKNYHSTYFNILKHYVQSCVSVDAVNSVEYGVKLSDLKLPPKLYKLAKENNIV